METDRFIVNARGPAKEPAKSRIGHGESGLLCAIAVLLAGINRMLWPTFFFFNAALMPREESFVVHLRHLRIGARIVGASKLGTAWHGSVRPGIDRRHRRGHFSAPSRVSPVAGSRARFLRAE